MKDYCFEIFQDTCDYYMFSCVFVLVLSEKKAKPEAQLTPNCEVMGY